MRLADAALTGSCAAFVVVPVLGPLVSGGEGYGAGPRSPIAPPGWAFGVWFPIFAACAVDTAARLREPGDDDAATRGPLAAAYVANAAWSVLAQTDRHRPTTLVLSAAAASSAVAVRRAARQRSPRPSTTRAAGLLLGWTALASAVNASTEARRGGFDEDGVRTTPLDLALLLTAGAALLGVLREQPPGSTAATASATWGLATTALTRSRPRPVRTSAAGLAALLVARVAARRGLSL